MSEKKIWLRREKIQDIMIADKKREERKSKNKRDKEGKSEYDKSLYL
mgnify:FL=1